MSEGYSDYFAATTLDNPVMGDYFMNDPKGFRSCKTTRRFPSGYAGEEHDVGEVWAGFLWSLRTKLGDAVANDLALESLQFLGPWRTVVQGREALLQADRILHPTKSPGVGANETTIRDLFDKRKP